MPTLDIIAIGVLKEPRSGGDDLVHVKGQLAADPSYQFAIKHEANVKTSSFP